jgi:hypothetical protein
MTAGMTVDICAGLVLGIVVFASLFMDRSRRDRR